MNIDNFNKISLFTAVSMLILLENKIATHIIIVLLLILISSIMKLKVEELNIPAYLITTGSTTLILVLLDTYVFNNPVLFVNGFALNMVAIIVLPVMLLFIIKASKYINYIRLP